MRRLLAVSLSVMLMCSAAVAASAQDQAGAGGSSLTPTAPGAEADATASEPSSEAAETTEAEPAEAEAAVATTTTEGETTNTAEAEAEAMDAGTYSVRLRDLEQRINELKEQIFRSKARLSLLADTVLQGVVAGGQARIVHENKMGSSYKLVKVVYALDGAPIFNKADEEGGLAEREKFDIYNGSIVPGEHTLTVQLEYRGHGYGIFSYLKGYRFKVNSSHTFSAPEGKSTTVEVIGYEKGGPTAPLEERPAIRYIERVGDVSGSEDAEEGDG